MLSRICGCPSISGPVTGHPAANHSPALIWRANHMRAAPSPLIHQMLRGLGKDRAERCQMASQSEDASIL